MTEGASRPIVPSDAVVAMRSFPRRYREVFASTEDDDSIDAIASRVGPEGRSAAEVVSDVTRTWAVLADALRQVLTSDDAVLHPAVADASQRVWDAPHPEALADTLDLLGHEADAVVDVVHRSTTVSDWSRSAAVAGGGRVTALDLLGDAVRTGSEGLTQAEAILRAVRG